MVELPKVVIAAGCLLALGSLTIHAGEEAKVDTRDANQDQRVVIDGVDRYRVCEPLFECVRVVLSHRGEKYSPAYLQGLSGAAFRIAGICPCAPTCSFAMETQELPKLLGYEVETLSCEGGGWERGEKNAAGRLARLAKKGVLPDEDAIADPELKELRRRLQNLIERTKDEVRKGRPVVFWNAFTTAEFDVVCGFDNEKRVLMGRGSYAGNGKTYAMAAETNAIMTALVGGCPTAILIGDKKGTFDQRQAEVAALKEAVSHAKSTNDHDKLEGGKWVLLEGLSCYDRWISDFQKPNYKRGMGDAYCYGIYRDTHRAAAAFLREIAPRYPAARAQLEQAAGHFLAEADTLKGAESLLWWRSPAGPDAARNKRAVEILKKARDEYAAGIQDIEQALAQIERKHEAHE